MPGFKGWFLVEALDHQPCVLVMKIASTCGGKKKKASTQIKGNSQHRQ